VSKRACNQIKPKTTPNYCTYSNAFSLQAVRLTFDVKRAGDCKPTRLQRGAAAIVADASVHAFAPDSFELAFSRFGNHVL
jgi:hypothetical protein